jgi:hypothetical protein
VNADIEALVFRTIFPLVLSALAGVSGLASAQGTDPAAAEVLFREARQLMEQGKLDEACPRFMESQRLDPATGTLLAVASCHEQQGQLATAWAEYTAVAGRAEKEGRQDRASVAKERARSLEPRLSTLTLSAPPAVLAIKGLNVRRDGVDFSSAVFNRALPIDGGLHTIELSAPGYLPESLSIQIDREADTATLVLPLLRSDPGKTGAPGEDTPRADASTSSGMTGRETLGIGIGAAGIAAATVGGAFLVAALVKMDQSNEYCTADNRCANRTGMELRADAVDWGNLATALGIGGAVLAAGGFTLYWLSGPETPDAPPRETGSLRVHGIPGGTAARLELAF